MTPRTHSLALGLTLSLIALASSLGAQILPLGGEIPVNGDAAYQPRNPVAVFGRDGAFTVIWENDQLGLFARSFDGQGRPAGPDRLLVANDRLAEIPAVGPVVYRSEPRAVPFPDGTFFLLWTEEASILHVQAFHEWREIQSRQIMGQHFSAGALPLGSRVQVSTDGEALHTRPQGAFHSATGLVVVWESDDQLSGITAGDGVFARRLTFTGNPLGQPVKVNTTPGASAARPALAVNGEGRALVAWEGCCDEGGDYGVFARLIEANGRPAGSDFRVNARTAGRQRRPAVSADPWSHFLVAWQGHVADEHYAFSSRIFGQLISRAGGFMAGEFQISDSAGTSQVAPALAPTPFGGYLVAWQDFNRNFPVGTLAVELDSFGNLTREETRLSSSQVGARLHTAVAADAKSEFLVTWEGYSGDEIAVMGKRLSAHEKAARLSQGLKMPN